jgi:methylenetetrahydrofolate reductase (NADPH)
MRIADLYHQKRPVFSFEFFPPKTDKGVTSLFEAIRELAKLEPDYVSVTCPLEKPRRSLTFELVARIQREIGITAMAHLVTVLYSRDEVRGVLGDLRDSGVENVLALRGDLPDESDPAAPRDFQNGSDLAAFAREFGFSIGGAAHPEMHPDSTEWTGDLAGARAKVDAGCEFLITQLFFDNADYFAFIERARKAGIELPIVPGIMPITNVAQIERITRMCGARIPDSLRERMHAVEEDEEAVNLVGIEYSTQQCRELLEGGAPGIHFYTLNKSPVTAAILAELRR